MLAKQVLVLSGVALWLGCASTARAGFVFTSINATDQSSVLSTDGGMTGASQERLALPRRFVETEYGQPGLVGIVSSTGSMSAPSAAAGSGISSAAALTPTVRIDMSRSLSRLIAERSCTLPRPPTSRLFRPPKSQTYSC